MHTCIKTERHKDIKTFRHKDTKPQMRKHTEKLADTEIYMDSERQRLAD